jgi:hypothetical protein
MGCRGGGVSVSKFAVRRVSRSGGGEGITCLGRIRPETVRHNTKKKGRELSGFLIFIFFKIVFYINIFLISHFTVLYVYRPTKGRQGPTYKEI